jgi:hypothetical protein
MIRLFSFSLLLALLLVPAVARGQFTGMKARIPADANTLILINAEKMFGSPVADREGWNARRKAAYEAGVSALPPDATEVVIAGRSDHEYGKSIWELGMIKLSKERNVTTVAQRFGGTMDNILGRSAARLPNDHYIVQIGPSLLGSHVPANRQDVTRWLRSTDMSDPSGSRLSPYLQRAFDYATKIGSPIVMAMDTGGVISEDEVKRKIQELESLKDANIPAGQLAKLISGTHGITLACSMGKDAIGAIRVDFAESPKVLSDIGKPLLIEILRRQGAMIDDINDWAPAISGNTFMLQGKLSTDGARRIMSVLELPRSLSDAMHDATSPGADQEGSAKLIATQQYYSSITTLVEDLRVKPKRDHVKTFGQAAMWYDKYARKIDKFPILNVDEALLNYGINIAAMFRDAEMAMKGVGMRTSLRTAGNNPSSGGVVSQVSLGYRGGTGYSGGLYGVQGMSVGIGAGRASLIEKGRSDAVIRGQERTSGASTVQDIWQGIDEATANIRREMTLKYKIEF